MTSPGGGDIELDGLPELDAYDDDPRSYHELYGAAAAVGGKRFGGLGGGGAMLVLAHFTAEDDKEVSVERGDVVRAWHGAAYRVAAYRVAA